MECGSCPENLVKGFFSMVGNHVEYSLVKGLIKLDLPVERSFTGLDNQRFLLKPPAIGAAQVFQESQVWNL